MLEMILGAVIFMIGTMTGWSLFKQSYIIGKVDDSGEN